MKSGPFNPPFRSLGASFENTFEVFNFLNDLIMFTFISLDKYYSSKVLLDSEEKSGRHEIAFAKELSHRMSPK
jgi:hypothetical protein